MKRGYGVIFDRGGQYVAHPNQEYIGQDASDEEFYKKMLRLANRVLLNINLKIKTRLWHLQESNYWMDSWWYCLFRGFSKTGRGDTDSNFNYIRCGASISDR